MKFLSDFSFSYNLRKMQHITLANRKKGAENIHQNTKEMPADSIGAGAVFHCPLDLLGLLATQVHLLDLRNGYSQKLIHITISIMATDLWL